MKRGGKALLPSEKQARGTWRPYRDGDRAEAVEPDSLPVQPDWLTEDGVQVWLDDIGRVSPDRLVTERDTTMFGTYCNLMGAIAAAWRTGGVPPAAHLKEARHMAEQFGIFGARSRLKIGHSRGSASNPFSMNGRRQSRGT